MEKKSHPQEHGSHIEKDNPVSRDFGILFSFHNAGIASLCIW